MITRFFMAVIIILLMLVPAYAQNLLEAPESVVFDSLTNRYIVSNWGHGDLVTIDQFGFQEYFIRDEECYAGLYLQDNILYVSCRDRGVKAFDLSNNEKILDMTIPNTTNLNDIVADTSGNLYVSYPTGSAIYKINITTGEWTTFVDEGLLTPNGMYFEAENNRLLVISYRTNSPVQAVDLADSSLSTVRTTTLDNLDGLARDTYGYYYVSSWQTNSVFRFNPDFSGDPVEYATFDDDPADIYINPTNNELAAPLFFTNSIDFVEYEENEVRTGMIEKPSSIQLQQNFPNPFNNFTNIQFSMSQAGSVIFNVYNIEGKLQRHEILKNVTYGTNRISFNALDLPSGTYIYELSQGDEKLSSKMQLIK